MTCHGMTVVSAARSKKARSSCELLSVPVYIYEGMRVVRMLRSQTYIGCVASFCYWAWFNSSCNLFPRAVMVLQQREFQGVRFLRPISQSYTSTPIVLDDKAMRVHLFRLRLAASLEKSRICNVSSSCVIVNCRIVLNQWTYK
jgi:hypothetical protein